MSIPKELKIETIINDLTSIKSKLNDSSDIQTIDLCIKTFKTKLENLSKLECLDLSVRAYCALIRANIKTTSEFIEYMEYAIKFNVRAKGIGNVTHEELLSVYEKLREE